MRYEQDLQIKVRERYRRLLVAKYSAYASTARLVRDWMRSQPVVAALLTEASLKEPDLDVDGWVEATLEGRGHTDWTHKTEDGQVTLIWALLNRIADAPEGFNLVIGLGQSTNFNDIC